MGKRLLYNAKRQSRSRCFCRRASVFSPPFPAYGAALTLAGFAGGQPPDVPLAWLCPPQFPRPCCAGQDSSPPRGAPAVPPSAPASWLRLQVLALWGGSGEGGRPDLVGLGDPASAPAPPPRGRRGAQSQPHLSDRSPALASVSSVERGQMASQGLGQVPPESHATLNGGIPEKGQISGHKFRRAYFF